MDKDTQHPSIHSFIQVRRPSSSFLVTSQVQKETRNLKIKTDKIDKNLQQQSELWLCLVLEVEVNLEFTSTCLRLCPSGGEHGGGGVQAQRGGQVPHVHRRPGQSGQPDAVAVREAAEGGDHAGHVGRGDGAPREGEDTFFKK